MTNALTVVSVSDIERMAGAVAKSKLFGISNTDEAMALMLIAQAEGLHPAIAARDYHIIKGKPSLKADAMLARFQTAGGKVKWIDYTDTKCSAEISHPQGGCVTVEWTIEMARKIGLTANKTWTQYPRQMLRARVISEGIRTVFPGVAVGIYTPEEVQDFDDKPMKDVTPTNTPEGGTTPKSAYGSAKAMKAKWSEIASALTNSATIAALGEVFVTYKADFNTMKNIDQQLYDSLVEMGTQRRKAIEEPAAREGSEADIAALNGYKPEADDYQTEDPLTPDDRADMPEFLVKGEKRVGI